MEKGGDDEWLARDKVEHVLFCFTLSVSFSLLLSLSRLPFLRRRRVLIGSLFSASAGAAKEIADQLGFFGSSGASSKDAAADLVGIVLAALVLKWVGPLRARVAQSPIGVEIV